MSGTVIFKNPWLDDEMRKRNCAPHIRWNPPGSASYIEPWVIRLPKPGWRPAWRKAALKKPALKKPAFKWPAPKKPAPKHPTCFLGKRVRKAFSDKKGGTKFFKGTVYKWLPTEQWYKVHYDDGDKEDYTLHELWEILI